jgi:arylsulfatase A-like enzyme
MSTRGHRATEQLQARGYSAQGAVDDADPERDVPRQPGGERGFEGGGGSNASGRKRRRRHRSPKGKRRHHSGQGGTPHVDIVSRERMFQDIEGLLRQIRERAEESAVWTEEQLNDFTQTVTGFTKSMEQESEQVSHRMRGEYQRIRDKLSQALRG